MMVTAVMDVGQEVASFQVVLGKLQGKQDGAACGTSKAEAYDAIANWFKENDAARIKDSENLDVSGLVCQFSTDVMSDDTTIVQAALPAMGFCLNQEGIVRAFTDEQSSLVVKALCNCLLKTDDKSLCTRALWCLAKQNIKPDVIKGEIHTILCSVEKAVQGEGSAKSMTVQHESINVIIRLQEQLPEATAVHAGRWGKLILPNLVHTAPRIRERAIHATHLGLVAMVKARAELAGPLVADLKSVLLTEMTKLFRTRNELMMLKVWTYYVTILGKTLHKGGSLINSLLGVIELGFKNQQPDVKRAAYKSWHALIENFSLDLDVLANAKRLKLLMQPFLQTNIRHESVVHAKIDAWWFLVRSLGPKLPSTFQVVCVPLLQSTLGSIRNGATGVVTPIKAGSGAPPFMQGFSTPQTRTAMLPATSPITPRLNLPSLNGSVPQQQTFASVQLRGVQMLAAILGIQETAKEVTGLSLPQNILSSPSVFSKIAPCLIPFVMDILFVQDETIGDLSFRIFNEFVEQVRGVVEGSSKRDSVGVFTLFMEHLTTLVNSNQLPPSTVLKLLDSVSQLPKKVLSSSSYHTGSAGVMHGTPALFITSLLFSQASIVSKPEERFFSILIRLVECGMASPGTFLGFSQSVMTIVDKVSQSMIDNSALWRMWSALAGPLLQHIVQTNDVNQGDSLEHDFSAVVTCLLFPVQRLLNGDLDQPTVKTLLKLWSDLYEAFARSASRVAIAEPNQCCEDISNKLFTQLDSAGLEKWCYVDGVSQVCRAITQNLDFSHYTMTTPGSPRHPGRRPKVKSRYQGNLTSLVKLVGNLTEACADLCKKQTSLFSPSLSQTNVVHWFSAAQCLIGAMSDCCRVGLPSYIHGILTSWSKPLGHFMHFVASSNIAQKDYLSAIEEKLERLWIDLTTTVQNRYSNGFDSAFLNVIAPALEAAFTYKKRSLRNYTLVFWTATFGNQDLLQYPDILKPCLAQMKSIGEISLPGWSEEDGIGEPSVIPETEDPDDVMAPPAPAVIPNFGGPSPQKMHGSFLHRLDDAKKLLAASSPVKAGLRASPRLAKSGQLASPLRSKLQTYSPGSAKRKQFASPMAADVAKRRLHVDEDKNTAFVVISSEPKKKRVLTEHQKEVMRTKRVSLALYNGLDQSQDTQAFKDFSQTQSQSQTSSPVPTPEIENLPDEAKKFDFSSIKEHNESAVEDIVEKSLAEETVKEKEREASQQKQEKPTRRVVTFFEPVKKLSSPIKDAGQILVEDQGASLIDKCATDAEANVDKGEDKKDGAEEVVEDGKESFENTESGTQSSVVIVEDTCPDLSQECNLLSGERLKDMDTLEQRNEEFDVPETQDDPADRPGVHDVSKDFMPVLVGGSPSKEDVIPESYLESPDKGDETVVHCKDSPTRDEPLDGNDLADVLPDGRFKTVVSTPIIKLQKLSQQDIELYSPKDKQGEDSSMKDERPRTRKKPTELSGVMDAASLRESPRLRRYRSDEIHYRKCSPKSALRSSSVSELSSPKRKGSPSKKTSPSKKASPVKKAEKLNILQTTQQDLVDLAERYELDGIAPLGDDLDQSIEECLAKLDSLDDDNAVDLPVMGLSQSDNNEMSEVVSSLKKGKDNEDEEMIDDILCSQQELFTNSMDETVIDVNQNVAEDLPEKTFNETVKFRDVSSKQTSSTGRKLQKSHAPADEEKASKESAETVDSQESTCTESVKVEQVKRKRGRRKLTQNTESKDVDASSTGQSEEVGILQDSAGTDSDKVEQAKRRSGRTKLTQTKDGEVVHSESKEESDKGKKSENLTSTDSDSTNQVKRRKLRAKLSQNTEIEDDDSTSKGIKEMLKSQDCTLTDSDNTEQIKRRTRSKPTQDTESEEKDRQEKGIAESSDTGRRRGRSRRLEDSESQTSESAAIENEDVKIKRRRSVKNGDEGDKQLLKSLKDEDTEGKKSPRKSGRLQKKNDPPTCSSLDEKEEKTDDHDSGRATRRSRKSVQIKVIEQEDGGIVEKEATKVQVEKRRRSRRSEVLAEQTAPSHEDQGKLPDPKVAGVSEMLTDGNDVPMEEGTQETSVKIATEEESQNEISVGVEMTAPLSEDVPEANSSSEDLFGTCPTEEQNESKGLQDAVESQLINSGIDEKEDGDDDDDIPLVRISSLSRNQSEVAKDSQDAVDSQMNDSVGSENDDDIPLVQIRASLKASTTEDKQQVSNDAGSVSEDSEIDFPILEPCAKEDKVSPTLETPPREQIADILTRIKDKDTPKHELSILKEEDVLTVTRSGRKCKPSSKIRCAKDILRKALMSPEGRHKISKTVSAESLKSPTRISPKALRSKAKKTATKETSPVNRKRRHKRRSQSPDQKEALEPKETPQKKEINSPNKNISSYTISPSSLKTLAEKVAQQVSPEHKLPSPKSMSAQKSLPLSPKSSTLTSSQMLRNVQSGRVSRRSKSPVSLRLRSKKLCLSSGPLQTRSGTKLSRIEIKKRNKKQKVTEEGQNSTKDSTGGTVTEGKQDEVIVIRDTMSQEVEMDNSTQVEQDGADLDRGKEHSSAKEMKNDEMDKDSCIVNEEASQELLDKDEDGDVNMIDLEQVMSQDSDTRAQNEDNIPQVSEAKEAFDEASGVEKQFEEHANENTASPSKNTPVGDHLAEAASFAQAVEEVVPKKNDSELKEGGVTQVKTRSKRSSLRLTFGELVKSMSEKTQEEDSSPITEDEKWRDPKDEDAEESSDSDDDDEGSDEEISSESDDSGDDIDAVDDERKKSDKSKNGKMEGTPIGVVTSGLDVQDTEGDIINSSQSPVRLLAQGASAEEEDTTDSPSQRLNFPSLSPPETEAPASPSQADKMTSSRMSMSTMEFLNLQFTNRPPSPIIPTKYSARLQGSPEGASMRPNWPNQVGSPEGSIPSIYSPNASPSSGILKRREALGSNSPSPSTKSRRVSFADKVFIEPEPLQDHSAVAKATKVPDNALPQRLAEDVPKSRLPMSPLVTTSTSKILSHCSKYITTPSKAGGKQTSPSSSALHRLRRKSPHSARRMKAKPLKTFPKSTSYASKVFNMVGQAQESAKKSGPPSQSTQGTPTQGSPSTQVDSSLEAQGESQGSVYPALAECSLPVETVLPQLTSSMWSRGLGQLVRARNIRTIGDLSSLSPMQVVSLPIKSPKVTHLKNVLSTFQTEKFPDLKGTDVDSKPSNSTNDDGSSTPPGRPAGQRSNMDVEEMSSKVSGNLSPPRSPQAMQDSGLLGRLETLVSDFRGGALDGLPAAELFKAHHHVNNLTDLIMDALKMKCHSPSMAKGDN